MTAPVGNRCGGWLAYFRAAPQRLADFRSKLVPPMPEQMLLELEPRGNVCEACGDSEEVNCAECDGFADEGCKGCGGDGVVTCECAGGPEPLDDEGDDDESE